MRTQQCCWCRERVLEGSGAGKGPHSVARPGPSPPKVQGSYRPDGAQLVSRIEQATRNAWT